MKGRKHFISFVSILILWVVQCYSIVNIDRWTLIYFNIYFWFINSMHLYNLCSPIHMHQIFIHLCRFSILKGKRLLPAYRGNNHLKIADRFVGRECMMS
jgi:hypothetical protein